MNLPILAASAALQEHARIVAASLRLDKGLGRDYTHFRHPHPSKMAGSRATEGDILQFFASSSGRRGNTTGPLAKIP